MNEKLIDVVTALTVSAIQSGNVAVTPESVSDFFKTVYEKLDPLLGTPSNVELTWKNE